MANEEHVRRLQHGVKGWNAWRRGKDIKPDLASADLNGLALAGADLTEAVLVNAGLTAATLSTANLCRADLKDANLDSANLIGSNLASASLIRADLNYAKMMDANLAGARLFRADLAFANLSGADLTGADLTGTILQETILNGSRFNSVGLWETVFADIDLADVVDLETCIYGGPSIVDHRTLQKSGSLPLAFLRGIGLPDSLISYLPSLLSSPIQHYSCFISYSTKDQAFAGRLHADLQNKGVRCWFAPHDMPIGGKILDEIDTAIRVRDKVLLILSEHSIESDWVEDEVTKAFEEERRRGQTVLFPIRLDDAVMETDEAWAAKLRVRHIGDFTRWKDHDAYSRSFERVLRDLTVKKDGVG